jgi:hypothetical protein
VKFANSIGLGTQAYDLSGVACDFGLKNFEDSQVDPDKNIIVHADFEEVLRGRILNPDKILIAYAQQFFQILKEEQMRNIMRGLGKIFRKPGKKLVIVHPLPEDNNKRCRWDGTWLPKPKWGDSTLYTMDQLIEPFREGAKRGIVLLREPIKVKYFHQTYTAFTIG